MQYYTSDIIRPKGDSMFGTRIRILYIGDKGSFEFLQDLVRRFDVEGLYDMSMSSDYDEACRTIEEERHDVYIVQCLLGSHEGLDIIRKYADPSKRTAFILLTDKLSLSTLTEAARCGAVDYLYRSELDSSSLQKSLNVSRSLMGLGIEKREPVWRAS